MILRPDESVRPSWPNSCLPSSGFFVFKGPGRKWFIWLACHGHSPSLREVKQVFQGRTQGQKLKQKSLKAVYWLVLMTCLLSFFKIFFIELYIFLQSPLFLLSPFLPSPINPMYPLYSGVLVFFSFICRFMYVTLRVFVVTVLWHCGL